MASFAAGSAIGAVQRTLKGEHSFALGRPSSHLTEPDKAMGFWIFNNVAIAAAHVLETGISCNYRLGPLSRGRYPEDVLPE